MSDQPLIVFPLIHANHGGVTFDPAQIGPRVASRPDAHFVGVEVDPVLIRAGVFADGVRLLGKTKFSTKRERGPESVIGRIARCVRYAADECDLGLPRIHGIAVGIRGWIDESEGVVRKSSELGWEETPLRRKLEEELAIPVSVANNYNLGALGILSQELKAAPDCTLAALFLGAEIGGALLRSGVWSPWAALPETAGLLEMPDENVFRTFQAHEFRQFRGRDFRKALRKGSQAAERFLGNAADVAAGLAVQLIRKVQPDVIAISGGAIEDIQETILRRIRAGVAEAGADVGTDSIRWISSRLGDSATITGAAAWAGQLSRRLAVGRAQADQPLDQALGVR